MIDYKKVFDQVSLEKDSKANLGRPFQRCSISVMDTIADPNITFDENGVCNYYHEYKKAETNFVLTGQAGQDKLAADIQKIKDDSAGKKYDCILGLSGGVDSTYLCHLAKEQGLNPLVVHCDNGWNSELAQHNIENTVKKCGFDLFTYVINWEHFRELQLSYIKASVVDIEVLTDHAFMAVLYEQARKWKIKYVLAGMNIVTEHVLPSHWIYSKGDAVNIKAIQKKFGTKTLKALATFPFLDYRNKKYCTDVLKMEVITPLNYIEYVYDDVKALIQEKLDWRDYGGKHYESVWTRFYQGYLLPRKFNIDKRKAHLSNLIFSGQLTREEALEKLNTPTYNSLDLMEEDLEYVIKKFGLTPEQFEQIINEPRREHKDYPTQKGFWEQYPYLSFLKPLRKLIYR
jgi:N-acetyl sugar amidotransferase